MRLKTHPGEVLREEFMVPMGISANALAIALRVPVTRISEGGATPKMFIDDLGADPPDPN